MFENIFKEGIVVNWMKDRIAKSKIDKYYKLTSEALGIARKAVVKNKVEEGEEIFLMVSSYLSDAMHFKKEGRLVDAYGALNYAHGWLDCGARLRIYRVSDNRLFTV
ncbi:hypothetical protein CMI38_01655 [Candidatus Pacearchaeota archaeon]|nr:hypothetical protein [Candidatus Pacearchaeota archaeon]|tara:strand:+ start:2590 stop:2910 length:321 start_codon:yes stop_codon:yes gene_type:complete